MNRRVARGLAVLACVVVAGTTTVVVEARSDDGASTDLALSANGLPPAEVVKYWSDTGNALAPLLLYVRQLPSAIKGVQATQGSATGGQIQQYGLMAVNFANARDLVGRIAVPAAAPATVGELLQVACQLYRQSALALTELEPASAGPANMATARRAASLQALGDRIFDQVRRVLDIDAVGKDQAPVEYQYSPPVPALADLTAEPVPAQAGPQDRDADLRSAARLISRASTGQADASPETNFQALRNIAGSLETHAVDKREDIIGVRLAIALALIAERANLDGQPSSADSLLMLSNDIWNQALTLNRKPDPALQQLDAPKLARSQVWTGGEFNGRPPALQPGQDVGSGLSGGLPKIDPSEILKG